MKKEIIDEDKINRVDELRQEAINLYLDKTDFDVYEFLTIEEGLELAKLEFELGDIDKESYNHIVKSLRKKLKKG